MARRTNLDLQTPKGGDFFTTEDCSGRFAIDALLRRHNFEIVHRTPGNDPIWRKGGHRYSQREALSTCSKEDVEDAYYAENLYWRMNYT